MINFTKVHALGNDFLLVEDNQEIQADQLPALTRLLCERHTGIGADGLILIKVLDFDRGRVSFRIFNADGSEAEISGNGLRCASAFLFHYQKVPGNVINFETIVGEHLLRAGGLQNLSCLRLNKQLEYEAAVVGTKPRWTINAFQQTLSHLSSPDNLSVNLNGDLHHIIEVLQRYVQPVRSLIRGCHCQRHLRRRSDRDVPICPTVLMLALSGVAFEFDHNSFRLSNSPHDVEHVAGVQGPQLDANLLDNLA